MNSLPTSASAAGHPLRRLFRYARPYRRDAGLASLYSVLNKVFDVLPEALDHLDRDTLLRLERDLATLLIALKVDERAAGIPLAQM